MYLSVYLSVAKRSGFWTALAAVAGRGGGQLRQLAVQLRRARYLSICPSIYLSIYICVSQSVCLAVSLLVGLFLYVRMYVWMDVS
jgi:hypothetical protein